MPYPSGARGCDAVAHVGRSVVIHTEDGPDHGGHHQREATEADPGVCRTGLYLHEPKAYRARGCDTDPVARED